jgi:hypothetical protein
MWLRVDGGDAVDGLVSANSCSERLGSGQDCFAHGRPMMIANKPPTVQIQNCHPSDHGFRMAPAAPSA